MMAILNCETCGEGRAHWLAGPTCPTCRGNPLVGDGRDDWRGYSRARMVQQFGPRLPGDVELLERYRIELGSRSLR